MGRAPCCDKSKVKKGPWSPEEDAKLKDFIDKNGTGGNWIALPQKAGLRRCGKSCRLRWLNYLRPNIKHGEFSEEEDRIICSLYATIGSRWSIIAAQLPGRTDNDIKNYWNTKLKKKLMSMMLIPPSSSSSKHRSIISSSSTFSAPPSVLIPTPPPPPQQQFSFYATPNSRSSLFSGHLESPFLHHHHHHPDFVSSPYNFQMSNHLQDPGLLNNMVMFGGSEVSGSTSSDGSCSQISYERSKVANHHHHVKQEPYFGHHHHQIISAANNNNSGLFEDDNNNNNQIQGHMFFLDHGGVSNVGPTNNNQQLQYDLEVVRELVSSSSSNNNGGHDNVNNNNNVNNNDFLLFNYENKTDEDPNKGMMYFY